MPPATDAAEDGNEIRPIGLYPSGTGITRSRNERRPSSGNPWPVKPSFSTHRAKQLRLVSAQRRISPITLDNHAAPRTFGPGCRSDRGRRSRGYQAEGGVARVHYAARTPHSNTCGLWLPFTGLPHRLLGCLLGQPIAQLVFWVTSMATHPSDGHLAVSEQAVQALPKVGVVEGSEPPTRTGAPALGFPGRQPVHDPFPHLQAIRDTFHPRGFGYEFEALNHSRKFHPVTGRPGHGTAGWVPGNVFPVELVAHEAPVTDLRVHDACAVGIQVVLGPGRRWRSRQPSLPTALAGTVANGHGGAAPIIFLFPPILHFLSYELRQAANAMRRRVSLRIFRGSNQAAVIVDNSARSTC